MREFLGNMKGARPRYFQQLMGDSKLLEREFRQAKKQSGKQAQQLVQQKLSAAAEQRKSAQLRPSTTRKRRPRTALRDLPSAASHWKERSYTPGCTLEEFHRNLAAAIVAECQRTAETPDDALDHQRTLLERVLPRAPAMWWDMRSQEMEGAERAGVASREGSSRGGVRSR